MSRSNKKILNVFFRIPWWVSVLLACCAYVSLKYIIPAVQTENAFLISLGEVGPYFAPFIALIFLLPAPYSLFVDNEKDNEEKLIAVATDKKNDVHARRPDHVEDRK